MSPTVELWGQRSLRLLLYLDCPNEALGHHKRRHTCRRIARHNGRTMSAAAMVAFAYNEIEEARAELNAISK
jgi:hypothetical protein